MPKTKKNPALEHMMIEYCPWTRGQASPAAKRTQAAYQKMLARETGAVLGRNCWVSEKAAIVCENGGLQLGDDSYIAAEAYITGKVKLGNNCTVNPFVTLRENVSGGDGIRIGAYTCMVGANHGFADTEVPIWKQPHSRKGILLGDDIWVGSHVTVLDGVKVGSHSILAAGAVVTKDVPEYAIVGGNPARVIRLRKKPAARAGSLAAKLEAFGRRAEKEMPKLLLRYRERTKTGEFCFVDKPGERKRVRPWCDAVELASMFGQEVPGFVRAEMVTSLRAFQRKKDGLVPEHMEEDREFDRPPREHPELEDRYNSMIINYALECLGSNPAWPVKNADEITVERLVKRLRLLPWQKEAWGAGHWIDCYASCLLPNIKYFGKKAPLETLFTWLDRHNDPSSGLWGSPSPEAGWLQPVNGFYRLTRGTYAQFGRRLPRAEKSIDTILEHMKDRRYFSPAQWNACNVLDVVHPLWLCLQQTSHRRSEAEAWMEEMLPRVLGQWKKDKGFSFFLAKNEPGLQGSEMWLSINYLMAAILGLESHLGYAPKGVHRLAPALRIGG